MRQVTHALLTRPPLSHHSIRRNHGASFDLHVLSTPPAFILSQDQTLVKSFQSSPEQLTSYSFLTLLFLRFDINVCSWIISLRNFQEFVFIVIYCLIINVLLLSRDSSFRLSHLNSLVNNFFKFFIFLICRLSDSSIRLSYLGCSVNNFLKLFYLSLIASLSNESYDTTPFSKCQHPFLKFFQTICTI